MRFRALPLLVVVCLLAAACNVDWTMFGFGAGHTGFTPDTSISKEAVQSSMVVNWVSYGPSPPAVANGVVYDDRFTYDAAGVTNCSGSPKTCQPLWTLDMNAGESSPAVVRGVEYIGSDDHKLHAFDAAGDTNCSGSPKTCQPLWTGATGGFVLTPTVADGVIYVASGFDDYKLYAFDAAGKTNCSGSPKTCQPLWTASADGPMSAPAVANGRVYVGADKLYAFDAAGVTNCSGSPKTCQPLWTAPTAGRVFGTAVDKGVVYADADKLYAFDAAGVTNCSGSPKTCQPLWTAAAGQPAVANGVVYAASPDGTLYAFDASGVTNCGGSPKTCQPLWNAMLPEEGVGAPTVANGVVYDASEDEFSISISAFDAAGATNCSGSPKTCQPLWTTEVGGFESSTWSPVVSHGALYVGGQSTQLQAFGLENVPPTTSILIPSAGDTLSGTATLDAAAADNVKVSRVEFHLTGGDFKDQLIGLATLTYYGWIDSWDTTTVPNGTYTLTSVAVDPAGNRASSVGTCVTVRN